MTLYNCTVLRSCVDLLLFFSSFLSSLLLIGGELGRLPAVVDGEDVLLLVGSELGRLPAVVVDGDDVLLLVGGELGRLPAVFDGEDALLLI